MSPGAAERRRLRLSVGASPARKLLATAILLPEVAVACALAWISLRLVVEPLTRESVNVWGELLPNLLSAVVFLLGAYVAGAAGYVMLGTIRGALWLDGDRLGQRIVLRTTWLDLATATLEAHYDPLTGGVQGMVARPADPDAADPGVEIRLPVARGGVTLPPAELTRLAGAITYRRLRARPDDPAFEIAERLRDLAEHPPDPTRVDTTS